MRVLFLYFLISPYQLPSIQGAEDKDDQEAGSNRVANKVSLLPSFSGKAEKLFSLLFFGALF
jgi:hypothetical protein